MRNEVLTVRDNEHSVVDSMGGGEGMSQMLPGLGSVGKKSEVALLSQG